MPAGIESVPIGIATFGTVKFLGYSGFAWMIKGKFKECRSHPLVIGGVRTLIGIGFGCAYMFLFNLATFQGDSGLLYYMGLFPVRMVEWSLLIWLFFDRKLEDPMRLLGFAVIGVLISYLLDIPAFIGLIMTGGLWIC